MGRAGAGWRGQGRGGHHSTKSEEPSILEHRERPDVRAAGPAGPAGGGRRGPCPGGEEAAGAGRGHGPPAGVLPARGEPPACLLAPLRSTAEAAGGPEGALESKGTKEGREAANIY